ncbi:glycoside hydrolase family 26 protein [Alistipes timonensis]
MRQSLLLLTTVALLGGCAGSQKITPVNPGASPEARQLLEFLYSIRGRYTLTGQHNFISDPARYDSVVFEMTGKRPVVWGSDFSFNARGENVRDYHHCGPMNLTSPWGECLPNGKSTEELRQGLVEEIKARHAEGRIITLMWHCCFPAECNDCNGSSIWTWKGRPSQLVWDELTTEGTRLNRQWKAQMNTIVPYLEQLRDARIPILWRPYHEMNGVWFWWCGKPGENGFKKLWIMTYDYLTRVHGLNNLLWVWNTNAPRDKEGDEAGPYADYYPGSEYVDVLAADVYHRDYKQLHHDDLKALAGGKLIALGEVGQLPDPESYHNQPDWSWFMVWGYFINSQKTDDLDSAAAVRRIYDDPRTLTLDEIDFSDGTYRLRKQE